MTEQPLYMRLIPEKAKDWKHQAIEASAGTGKTWTIERLVVELLKLPPNRLPGRCSQPLSLSEILVVTFTEKAAGELKLRIRKMIQESVQELRKVDPNSPLIFHLENCSNRFDEAAIYTIHGFCKKYLDSFAFEGRLSMQLELADAGDLVDQVVRNFFSQGGLDQMDPQMAKKLIDGNPENLISILKSALTQTTSNDQILFPAWDSSLQSLSMKDLQQDFHSAFQSIPPTTLQWIQKCLKANELVFEKGKPLKLIPELAHVFEALVYSDSSSLVLEQLASLDTCDPSSLTDKKTLINSSYWADLEKSLLIAHRYSTLKLKESWSDLISTCRNAYQQLKESQGVQTFGDMIQTMAQELQPADSLLLQSLRSKFRFGIIDEFQDTSQAQWALFKRIFVDDAGTPLQRVLWLIGDRKQSIYRFQSADVETCVQAMDYITAGKRLSLDLNFRSSPQMVASYNLLFEQEQWFDKGTYPNIRCGKKAEEFPSPLQSPKKPFLDCSTLVWDLQGAKKEVLTEWTVHTIAHLIYQQGVSPQSICVLFEKNSEMFPVLQALRSHGIRASMGGETGLFASDECLQVIHLFKAMHHPSNHSLLKQVALGFFFAKPLHDLWMQSEQEDYLQEIRMQLMHWQQSMQNRQYERCVDHIIHSTQIDVRLSSQTGGARSLTALRQILTYSQKLLRVQGYSLHQLIQRLSSLYQNEDQESAEENTFHRESGQEAVQLMTLHKSKGLEFDIVFLCTGVGEPFNQRKTSTVRYQGQMCLAIHPLSLEIKQHAQEQEASESKRLWYVGLTRAKHMQFIPWWKSKRPKNTASLFLDQVLDHVMNPKPPHYELITEQMVHALSISPKTKLKGTLKSLPEHVLSIEDLSKAKILQRRRLQTSYSALAKHATTTAPQLRSDGGRLTTEDESTIPVLAVQDLSTQLPPGADTGNALHGILENLDFQRIAPMTCAQELLDDAEIHQLIQKSLSEHRLLNQHVQERLLHAATMVWNTLHAQIRDPFNDESFRLVDIPIKDRRAELEYHLRFNHADQSMAGTVYGFMDLVFRRDNRYYILDWKSNRLPGYSQEQVQEAMQNNDYILQASLYAEALRQFLAQQGQSPLPQIGGAIYVFLRGTQAQQDYAIWTETPPQLSALWTDSIQSRLNALTQGDTHV